MRRLWVLAGRVAFWTAWPLLFVYLLRGERTRVIIRCGKEVLVVRGWLGSGRWILPGGGMHAGEDAVAGAIREVREETSLVLRPEQMRYVGVFNAGRGLRFRYHLFATELVEKPQLAPQKYEITHMEWMLEDALRTTKTAEGATVDALRTWSTLDDLVQ